MQANIAALVRAVAAAIPDRECIVWKDLRLTFADVDRRTDQLAQYLVGRGLGTHTERSDLSNHESGQDHVGIYLHNGNEYPEAMLGAWKARTAHFNVNYRYVAEELRYLLSDSRAKALVYHAAFAPTLAGVLGDLPDLDVLIQVADDSGNDLLPGAVDYESALAAHPAEPPDVELSPDDLYILYTGGTTGMPKGVLWRQGDIWPAAMGGRNLATGEPFTDVDDLLEAAERGGAKLLPGPPFMHGAAQWLGVNALTNGNTIVFADDPTRLDPHDVWSTVDREGVNVLLIVGDAFGRPLADALDEREYELSSLILVVSGGAPLNSTIKDRLLDKFPMASIADAVGASETGSQMSHSSSKGQQASTGRFTPGPGAVVVSAEMDRVLDAGHEDVGWLAQRGYVPLGYLGDADKTARTFPEIGGMRYAVPGDRARLTEEGEIELYGRDSVTINSGGEKIFAEEVEQAVGKHPAVADVVVAGRPSEQWGQEVVAVVSLRDGEAADDGALLAEAEAHIARYKLPKAFVYVDEVVRSPAGKADYRWAREQAEKAL